MVEHFDRDFSVLQRHRGAGPQPARIFALRARHLLVPHHRIIASLARRHVRKCNGERPDRAHDVDLVAEPVHVRELLVEIEPIGPAVEVRAGAVAAPVVVTAVGVAPSAWESLPLAKLVEHRARPPMEMGVDDVHGFLPCLARSVWTKTRNWRPSPFDSRDARSLGQCNLTSTDPRARHGFDVGDPRRRLRTKRPRLG